MSENRQDLPSKLAKARQQLQKVQARVATLEAQLFEDQPNPTLLLTNEDRYHRTLDNLLEGCQIIGFDWRYLYLNDTAARHGQRAKEELLGYSMMERYPGIGKTEMFAVLQRSMQERTLERMENEFIYPDGAAEWFDLSVQPMPEGIFILTLDITERKRSETALKRYAERMEILHEIDLGLIQGGSIEAIVEGALKHLRQLIPCQQAGAVLFDFTTSEVIVFAIDFKSPSAIARGNRLPLPPGFLEEVATRPVTVIDDLQLIHEPSPTYQQLIKEGLRSSLRAMLIIEGHSIGVLSLNANTPSFFTAEHTEIAAEIANQLAISIHQMHLSEELERHADELERRVTERTADLNDAKERVEAILNNSTDGILLVHTDLTIQQTNSSFNRLFDCEQDDYFGKSLVALVHAEDADRVTKIVQAAVAEQQGKSIEIRTLRKDGK